MKQRPTVRSIAAAGCLLAGLAAADRAAADDPLREVYFHDAARNHVGDMIIVQTNPETEVLVFNGGELALEGGSLVVIARHARIDADTFIRAYTQGARLPKPGEPDQAARGADGAKAGNAGGNGAPGSAGAAGDDGGAAGKLVLRIGEIAGKGRLVVDMSGQAGGQGQRGGRGGDGGDGRDGQERACGSGDPSNGGHGGDGGIGGQGGQGGRGGNGGIVVYSKAMASLIASRHFLMSTAGGVPGAGGDPGLAGNPGKGGLGGAGVVGCSHAGSDGMAGQRILGAQPGAAGQPGSAGAAIEEEAP